MQHAVDEQWQGSRLTQDEWVFQQSRYECGAAECQVKFDAFLDWKKQQLAIEAARIAKSEKEERLRRHEFERQQWIDAYNYDKIAAAFLAAANSLKCMSWRCKHDSIPPGERCTGHVNCNNAAGYVDWWDVGTVKGAIFEKVMNDPSLLLRSRVR